MKIRQLATGFLLAVSLLPLPGFAHTVNAPTATGDLVQAGGGAGSFSMVRAFTTIAGQTPFQSVLLQERNRYGRDAVNQFVEVFDFAVADGWKLAGTHDVAIHTDAGNGAQLVGALVKLGTNKGRFDSGTLFNALFTPQVSALIAGDVAKRYGNDAMLSFYRVGNTFFNDLQTTLANG